MLDTTKLHVGRRLRPGAEGKKRTRTDRATSAARASSHQHPWSPQAQAGPLPGQARPG